MVRDLLFRRFVSLSLADSVPDHSTLWCFRNNPTVENLQGAILAEINEQFSKKSLYIKVGAISIVDASLIQAQRNRLNKDNTQDPEAERPIGFALRFW